MSREGQACPAFACGDWEPWWLPLVLFKACVEMLKLVVVNLVEIIFLKSEMSGVCYDLDGCGRGLHDCLFGTGWMR